MRRRTENNETWHRLVGWDRGQAASERLAAQLLISEKYEAVDPSHPLGGRDGLKDILCQKDGLKYVAACYFPRGQQEFPTIVEKFVNDIKGVAKNKVDGIAFITNQELRLGERDELLQKLGTTTQLDLFHLERVNAILNSPINYGTRLEFLDIEMTKEEQLAYMSSNDQLIHELKNLASQIIHSQQQLDRTRGPITVNLLNQSAIDFQDSKIEPLTVIPETISGYIGDGGPIHKCGYCSYSYKVFRRGLGTYSSPHSYIGTRGRMYYSVVTCPKCGNVENS